MSFIELLILSIGLAMDAFAVAVCTGLTMHRATVWKMLIVGLYFGLFQALMPVIGFFVAALFAEKIVAYGHWIAFALLLFLGGKMIWESFKKKEGDSCCQEASLKPARMLPLAVATSIDALAVGASFVFLEVTILPAASLIGVVTLVISMAGVKIGHVFGAKFQARAELAGGVILVLIGVKIALGI